ncbi:1-(5-phosphoribosyl)-5-((5-phosphoribosylamino)methylideneamino)imidazole-4-carboxamide isomerase [Candidatus Bipolaricaulota bacterium]|nr:1-(5-phosphoribosyl)-5-((5-phosphoribosylamino)methylideneamino)imidazole-4-carboxamide isomerase [Candidatus Bipolaricaulota bacterium]
MKIYPAIDLMNGKVVRLKEGKKETKKVYGNPVEIAEEFAQHVDKVHVVDLDGAFSGKLKNIDVVREIISKTDLKVQFGGGIRSIQTLKKVKNIGVENPIIGTKAMEGNFLAKATEEFEGITVSLDMKPDGLAIEGWKKSVDSSYREVFEEMKKYTGRFIFTSVSSDGTLEGVGDVKKFWGDQEVIYAGGISSLEDLRELEGRGFSGGIIGKALYENQINLGQAIELFGDQHAG